MVKFTIIFRIPAHLKDRRLRPHDVNKGPEILYGTIRRPNSDIHNFREPNDPTYNLWINFSLEDFAHYWELPNVLDAKYCYFQEINMGKITPQTAQDVFPMKSSIDQVLIENGKDSHLHLDRSYRSYTYLSSACSGLFLYMFYLAA
jgi:hypothetical protein